MPRRKRFQIKYLLDRLGFSERIEICSLACVELSFECWIFLRLQYFDSTSYWRMDYDSCRILYKIKNWYDILGTYLKFSLLK